MAFWRGTSIFSSSTPQTTTTNDKTNNQETIERLCDRLQSAVRIDDRRDALRNLKGFSKKCKLEVATQSMLLLANILQGDRTDLELIQLALETLSNVMTYEPDNHDEQPNLPQDINIQFTELFIKNKEQVHAALDLIEEIDFNIRRTAIKFLTVLLTNCTKLLQDIILESGPMGVSKLVDLLQDEREVIRNDTLLLLQILTRSNANIQKIVAFENGFERLFEILISEGGSDGGVIVEDCLAVLLNLLKTNPSNQSYFRESSFIRRLVDCFALNSIGNKNWLKQKETNIRLFLQIIRTLVSPTNSNQNIVACQRTISQCGLLHRLCVMLTISTIPPDVLAEAINTIGEIIRGHAENQQFFCSVMNTTGESPQPVLLSLLYIMVAGEKQLFTLRIAILYCFQCYLCKNDYGKAMIVQTLLPQTENASNQYTLGHLLIVGFLSKDIVAAWCSNVALAHLIIDNQQLKEAVLKVVLAIDQSQLNPKSLMEISIDLLENSSSSFHTRVAILSFLCTWLSNCQLAVQTFLSIPNSISYLISQICSQSVTEDREVLIQSLCSFAFGLCLVFNNNQVSTYSTESLERIIKKRIGVDLFQEKLELLSKSDCYAKALQKPQLTFSKSNDMVLDYEFSRLYKILEGSITRLLTTRTNDDPTKSSDQSTAMLAQYTDLLQQQNQQINAYQNQEKQFLEERNFYQQKIFELEQSLQEIREQHTSLKLSSEQNQNPDDGLKSLCEQQQMELEYLRNMMAYQQQQYYYLTQPVENGIEQLNVNHDDNQTVKNEQQNHVQEQAALNVRISELQEKINAFDEQCKTQNDEIARLQLENNILQEKLTNEKRKVSILESLQGEIQEVIDQKAHLNNEYEKLNVVHQKNIKEQNELLLLCSTYESQLRQCRNVIQSAGLTVPNFLLEMDDAL
ncbi:unnamed protein product [Rotaria magnacalcarata]|uniref:Vesicle tethering protein Uso1/P115-like head domain-containing protein n=1 Tax=Rotaria magnacalcarata TaxID=392030 RepID=A0A816AX19_9BILA|nr:unnamed protein product [Rotaria magnacalcarata]CAF1603227.1 unnamed protein product [Rotaria magnacalcarata]